MRAWLLVFAACGGGSGDGDGGKVDATVNGSAFSGDCKFTETEMFMDVAATSGSIGLELKWNKSLIHMTGTFMTGGIVSDLSLFASIDGEISSATGKVVFTTYEAPDAVVGTFEMTVPAKSFTATGSFDCH